MIESSMFPEYSIFPKELEDVIIYQLSPFDLLRCVSLVSKQWRDISNDENVWNALFFKKFDLLISSKNTWKEQFKEVYEAHLIIDGLYRNILQNSKVYKHILDVNIELICRTIDVFVADFKWIRPSKVIEKIPVFVIRHEERSEMLYENISKKIVKNFYFSVMLANHENYQTLLVEKGMSLGRYMKHSWEALFIKEELLVERIKVIEALLNDKLWNFIEIAYQHNLNKLSTIQDWNVAYYLTLGRNGKIRNVSKDLAGMKYCSGLYLGRIKCSLQGPNKSYEWILLDCYKPDTKQEFLIYQSMEKTITALNHINQDV